MLLALLVHDFSDSSRARDRARMARIRVNRRLTARLSDNAAAAPEGVRAAVSTRVGLTPVGSTVRNGGWLNWPFRLLKAVHDGDRLSNRFTVACKRGVIDIAADHLSRRGAIVVKGGAVEIAVDPPVTIEDHLFMGIIATFNFF